MYSVMSIASLLLSSFPTLVTRYILPPGRKVGVAVVCIVSFGLYTMSSTLKACEVVKRGESMGLTVCMSVLLSSLVRCLIRSCHHGVVAVCLCI